MIERLRSPLLWVAGSSGGRHSLEALHRLQDIDLGQASLAVGFCQIEKVGGVQ